MSTAAFGKDKKSSYKGKYVFDAVETSKLKPKDEKAAQGFEFMISMFKAAKPVLEIKSKTASMKMNMEGQSKTENLKIKIKDGKTYLFKDGDKDQALVTKHSKSKIKLTFDGNGKKMSLVFKKK